MSPANVLQSLRKKIKQEWKTAFLAAMAVGLLIHLPAMLSDIPNHDGLDSLYFDQNMITSGRWFLTVACGFSSFYSIPWVIGLLGLLFLSLAAAALVELLEVKKSWAIVAISGLLVAFPAIASTFAYVFTLDGYMLALLLAVLSVLLTRKYRYGFLPGALCLAFSMGTYQAYLPFAMILSIFAVAAHIAEKGEVRGKLNQLLRYLLMGILGSVSYYGILRLLLWIQGKELASYQGISGMTSLGGLIKALPGAYRDFFAFTLKGNVLFNNGISGVACAVLAVSALAMLLIISVQRKWWKNPWFFVIIIGIAIVLPPVTNVILLISPGVNYHLLMRYQWVLYLIGMTAVVSKYGGEAKRGWVLEWMTFAAALLLVFFYGVTDNIGYANLHKKYEKTYAYCVRLLDRIEQTPGYYPGIPIAMIGVVGDEQFPVTDLTQDVTSGMIGINGDILLYTGPNYRKFIQNYLGATLNILPAGAMAEMYYDEEYVAMESFPGEDSIRIIDGIMYIKTENTSR